MSPSDALKGMGRSERKGGGKIGGEEVGRRGGRGAGYGRRREEGRIELSDINALLSVSLHTVVSWGGLASMMPREISFRSFSTCTVNWSHTFSGEYTFVCE